MVLCVAGTTVLGSEPQGGYRALGEPFETQKHRNHCASDRTRCTPSTPHKPQNSDDNLPLDTSRIAPAEIPAPREVGHEGGGPPENPSAQLKLLARICILLGIHAAARCCAVQRGHTQSAGENTMAPMPVSYTHLTLPTNREV